MSSRAHGSENGVGFGRLPVLGDDNYPRWKTVVAAHLEDLEVYYTANKDVEDPEDYDGDNQRIVRVNNKAEEEVCLVEALIKINDARMLADKEPLEQKLAPTPVPEDASDDVKQAFLTEVSIVRKHNENVNRLAQWQYKKDCKKAKANIFKVLDSTNIARVNKIENPALIWSTLQEYHNGQTTDNVNVLLAKIQGGQQENFNSMEEYLKYMWDLFGAIESAGGTMTEKQFCLCVITGLRDEYEMYGVLLQGDGDALRFKKCAAMLKTAEMNKLVRQARKKGGAPAAKNGKLFTQDDVEAMVAKAMQAHGRQRQSKASAPCFQWRDKGTCSFGERCRFTHRPKDRGDSADE
jgi:hypothetical protein